MDPIWRPARHIIPCPGVALLFLGQLGPSVRRECTRRFTRKICQEKECHRLPGHRIMTLLTQSRLLAGETLENDNRLIRGCLCNKSLDSGIRPSDIRSIAPRESSRITSLPRTLLLLIVVEIQTDFCGHTGDPEPLSHVLVGTALVYYSLTTTPCSQMRLFDGRVIARLGTLLLFHAPGSLSAPQLKRREKGAIRSAATLIAHHHHNAHTSRTHH